MSASFDDLPGGCVAGVLSMTSPKDACRLSVLSSIFRSGADSDTVWERFLPSDYKTIVSEADESFRQLLVHLSKKQLYMRLCDTPLLIDGGKKSFFLDKCSGKKCYMIAAAELGIAWGGTPRYWRWESLPESRFTQVGVLHSVCWLAVNGKIDASMLSFNTNYAAYFVFKLSPESYGFKDRSVEVSVGIGGDVRRRNVFLDPESEMIDGQRPTARRDGWLEIEMGEYFIEEDVDGDLEMSLKEVVELNWKKGLIIEGIEVRPK